MVLSDARHAVAAANRMLTAVRDGGVASAELRAALEQTRMFMAAGAAFQTAAAELIARRERHGDGGAGILAEAAGLSQREAHDQVATAASLRQVPGLRDAVQAGEVPQANARRLADAITKTGSEAVAGDRELLAQARSMRPEQFARTAQRWVGAQQADDGTAEYLRQRARRYLRIYDTDDGMVALHGEFDKITGTRIRNRLRHTAGRLLDADKKLPQAQRRKFPQCMADALQHCTTRTSGPQTGAGAHSTSDETDSGCGGADASSATGGGTGVDADRDLGRAGEATNAGSATGGGGGAAGWVADITVLAHVDDTTGELIGELSDGSKLPAAVLEELSCNARWAGLVYDRAGDAIWRSRSRRTVTDTQWQALLATYGGCFHCGAPAGMCQAHHITPYSQGGATNIKNLIMVCWNCHHKIHHHNWRIEKHSDGSHTLHPPDDTATATKPRFGPACADEPPKPAPPAPAQQNRARTRKGGAQDRTRDRTTSRARDPATPKAKAGAKGPAPDTLW